VFDFGFGPHFFDLMSLDHSAKVLFHYSPWPNAASRGTNAFLQPILSRQSDNCPFVLVGAFLPELPRAKWPAKHHG